MWLIPGFNPVILFFFCYFVQELLLKVPSGREWSPAGWAMHSHKCGILWLRLIHSISVVNCWLFLEGQGWPWPCHGAGWKRQQRCWLTHCGRAQWAWGLLRAHTAWGTHLFTLTPALLQCNGAKMFAGCIGTLTSPHNNSFPFPYAVLPDFQLVQTFSSYIRGFLWTSIFRKIFSPSDLRHRCAFSSSPLRLFLSPCPSHTDSSLLGPQRLSLPVTPLPTAVPTVLCHRLPSAQPGWVTVSFAWRVIQPLKERKTPQHIWMWKFTAIKITIAVR